MQVGIRELRSRLAEILDRAAAGERVVITDRGTPKAVLGPPQGTSNIQLGIEEGWITAGAPADTPAPVPTRRYSLRPGWSSERALSEDRGV